MRSHPLYKIIKAVLATPAFLCILFFALLSSCGKDNPKKDTKPEDVTAEYGSISVVSGNEQTGYMNRSLPLKIIVRVNPKKLADTSLYYISSAPGMHVGRKTITENGLNLFINWTLNNEENEQKHTLYVFFKCTDCKPVDSITLSAKVARQWTTGYSAGAVLQDLHAFDDQNLLIIAERSRFRSTDGGANWTRSENEREMYKLTFLDKNYGFASIVNNYAYFTNDGGKTFEFNEDWTYPIIGHQSSNAFYMVNKDIIFSAGTSGRLVKTADGGKTWEQYKGFDFLNTYTDIKCLDDNNCFACGAIGKLVKTADAGLNWQEVPLLLNNNLYQIYFFNHQLGFAIGQRGALVRTENGGLSWQIIKTGLEYEINAIHFYTDRHGFIVSYGGEILETTDGGLTWSLRCVDNYGASAIKEAHFRRDRTIIGMGYTGVFTYNLD